MNTLEVDIFALVLITFTLVMTKRNIKFSHHNGNYFLMSCVVTMVVIIMEILDFNLERLGNINYIWVRAIINAIGFGISPLIIYFLIFFCDNEEGIPLKGKIILLIPNIINIILCLISIFVGLIFSFKNGIYQRGPLFLYVSFVFAFYIFILFWQNLRNNNRFAKKEFNILLWTILIVIISSSVQMIFGEIHTIWVSVSIGLFVYYVFIRDMQFEYDIMTELKNRSTYEKDLLEVKKENKVSIIVFDINNMKEINDTYGHAAGDDAIITSSKIILEMFDQYGDSYRIGGDEFVTLCVNTEESKIKKAICSFSQKIAEINELKKYDLKIPYGVNHYYYEDSTSIVDAIKVADKRMYECKKRMKETE